MPVIFINEKWEDTATVGSLQLLMEKYAVKD
jgi:hypothetical protein